MTGPQPPYGDHGGQTPGGGGDWQAPSNQTGYSPSASGGPVSYDQPQAYDQPGYEPGYEQPQQYDQYDPYGQQHGFPDQYSAPPAAYPTQPGYDPNATGMMPPPPSSTNYLPWALGGLAGLMVLVIAVIAGVLLINSDDSKSGGGGTSGGGSNGGSAKYTAATVSNACDLVDPTALKKWAKNEDEEPEHTESKNDYNSTFTCSARYKGGGDDYANASILMYASVLGEDSTTDQKESFERSEKSAKGQTGTGRTNGDISGLGEDAYYAAYEISSDYSSSVIYELGVLDGNLTFTIHLSVFAGEKSKVTKDDVAKAAEEQARKVMEGLKA